MRWTIMKVEMRCFDDNPVSGISSWSICSQRGLIHAWISWSWLVLSQSKKMPRTHVRHFTAEQQEDKRTDLPAAAHHNHISMWELQTAEDLGLRSLTFVKCTHACTHTYTPTCILYILKSVTHIKIIMNWFIGAHFPPFDSNACYVTYCFYTTFYAWTFSQSTHKCIIFMNVFPDIA